MIRRRRGGWKWQPTPEGERRLVQGGALNSRYDPSIDCAMVTVTGKRCLRGWMHRLGHSTVQRPVDEGYGGPVSRG